MFVIGRFAYALNRRLLRKAQPNIEAAIRAALGSGTVTGLETTKLIVSGAAENDIGFPFVSVDDQNRLLPKSAKTVCPGNV